MATSPFTVGPRVALDAPDCRAETRVFAQSMQELARLDQAKTRSEDALRLWLRWNAIHETLSSAMFDQRHDQREIERMMDEAEALRLQAVQLSRECLGD